MTGGIKVYILSYLAVKVNEFTSFYCVFGKIILYRSTLSGIFKYHLNAYTKMFNKNIYYYIYLKDYKCNLIIVNLLHNLWFISKNLDNSNRNDHTHIFNDSDCVFS